MATRQLVVPQLPSPTLRVAILRETLTRQQCILPLIILRVAFGTLMLASTLRFLMRGWVQSFYIDPQFHFTYLGFSWVRPLPLMGMYAIFGLQLLCCVAIIIGWRYRLGMSLFFLLFTYVELIDKTYYLNHYYFVSVFALLLSLLPLNGRFSVDARRQPDCKRLTVPNWMLVAVRLQIGVVYFYAGVAKLNTAWLFEAMPLRIWLRIYADMPLVGSILSLSTTAYLMSWAGVTFDLTIPLLLTWRRSRPIAYLGVIGFHLVTGLLFNIGMFPWIMIACTLVFFDKHDWSGLRSIAARIKRRSHELCSPAQHENDDRQQIVDHSYRSFIVHRYSGFTADFQRMSLIGLLLLFQLLMPLRHWLYPGNVHWTEEGYRFAWKVMLNEKTGHVTFDLYDPVDGNHWMVFPSDYLSVQQEKQMSFQPDMILQFAHFIAEQHARPVRVYAHAYVSHNGSSSRLLIDPAVDLAAEPYDWRPRDWILP